MLFVRFVMNLGESFSGTETCSADPFLLLIQNFNILSFFFIILPYLYNRTDFREDQKYMSNPIQVCDLVPCWHVDMWQPMTQWPDKCGILHTVLLSSWSAVGQLLADSSLWACQCCPRHRTSLWCKEKYEYSCCSIKHCNFLLLKWSHAAAGLVQWHYLGYLHFAPLTKQSRHQSPASFEHMDTSITIIFTVNTYNPSLQQWTSFKEYHVSFYY